MKKFLPLIAAGIMALSLATDADAARRFGGGSSFGRPAPAQMAPANRGFQQQTPAQKPAAAPQQQKAAPAGGAAAAKPASPLRNMLMGAAAMFGLAALANYLGFGESFASIMMLALIVLAAMMLFRMFASRKRSQENAAPYGARQSSTQQTASPFDAAPAPSQPRTSAFQSSSARGGSVLDEFSRPQGLQDETPSDFDRHAFLSECRKNFSALQQAWSTGNVLQLSDFCTDEVFTVITHQLRDRKGEKISIEVQSLDAELKGIVREGDEYVAAVHFTGRLHVTGSADEIEDVNEVWSLVRPVQDSSQGWLLAGIQQVQS